MSNHAHPLSDTDYYINHPDEYTKAMANRRRHESCQVYKPQKYVPPPKPPSQYHQISRVAEDNSDQGVIYGDDGDIIATPM
jgi:hypothetical protein